MQDEYQQHDEEIKEAQINVEMQHRKSSASDVCSDFEHNIESKQRESSDYILPREELKPIPRKYLLIVSFFLLAGSILLILGIIGQAPANQSKQDKKTKSMNISFIIIGVLLLIPGTYFGYKLYLACQAKTNEERQDVINEFPIDPN